MPNARTRVIAAVVAALALTGALITAAGDRREPRPVQGSSSGWQLPPEAPATKNPLTVDDKVVAAGREVFTDKCKKCHGPEGLGDGPDADPDFAEEMNLTNPKRAARNPDGVVFFKVTNGRKKPKMPSFKDELTPDQIWSVVSYVQTLRRK
jgi:mono/diheme cytochrome c family protein